MYSREPIPLAFATRAIWSSQSRGPECKFGHPKWEKFGRRKLRLRCFPALLGIYRTPHQRSMGHPREAITTNCWSGMLYAASSASTAMQLAWLSWEGRGDLKGLGASAVEQHIRNSPQEQTLYPCWSRASLRIQAVHSR